MKVSRPWAEMSGRPASNRVWCTNPANQKNDSTRQPCPRAGSRFWPARRALKWDRNDNAAGTLLALLPEFSTLTSQPSGRLGKPRPSSSVWAEIAPRRATQRADAPPIDSDEGAPESQPPRGGPPRRRPGSRGRRHLRRRKPEDLGNGKACLRPGPLRDRPVSARPAPSFPSRGLGSNGSGEARRGRA